MKRENGITLIALVITIIVLLILAGVSIVALTGDNGLLQKTTYAKIASEEAELQEEVQLSLIENEVNKYTNTEAESSLTKIFEKIHGVGNIEFITKSGKNYKVVVKGSNIRYRISSDGKVTKYEEMQPTNVYAKLDTDGTLYLKATEDKTNGYKTYTGSASIQINWSDKTPASVTKVVIEEPIAPRQGYFQHAFHQCTNLTTIEKIENLHTENLENFDRMFSDCVSLTYLDLSKFDTSKSKNLAAMFNNCTLLTRIDGLENFDISNAIYIFQMFDGCSSITNLDLSNFDTSNVLDVRSMFSGCSALTKLNLSNFNTSNVTNMQGMFNGCTSLTNLDISSFNTNNVSNMYYMFFGDTALKELNLGKNFIIKEGCNVEGMFSYNWSFDYSTSGLVIKAIPVTVTKIKNIPNFKFSDNNFYELK